MDIDTHQHFWHYPPRKHTWMSADMPGLKRDHLPADLEPVLAANGIGGTVAVQARQRLDETDWLLALADQHSFILGVVGWMDLQSPLARDYLPAWPADVRARVMRGNALETYHLLSA